MSNLSLEGTEKPCIKQLVYLLRFREAWRCSLNKSQIAPVVFLQVSLYFDLSGYLL